MADPDTGHIDQFFVDNYGLQINTNYEQELIEYERKLADYESKRWGTKGQRFREWQNAMSRNMRLGCTQCGYIQNSYIVPSPKGTEARYFQKNLASLIKDAKMCYCPNPEKYNTKDNRLDVDKDYKYFTSDAYSR